MALNERFEEVRTVRLSEICDYLKSRQIPYELDGDGEREIHRFCPLNHLQKHSMTWARKISGLPLDELNGTDGIVLFAELGPKIQSALFPVIYVENVHRTFFRVTEFFFGDLNPEKRTAKIEPSAVVETTSIGENVYVGHHTYISADVSIGDDVTIMHNVTIDGKVEIGDGTFIESGTVIGACGFGYMTDEHGKWEIVPHYAGVKIGRNVRIGANNTIIRGCLSDTVIEDDVKTADLVCISHNDVIGEGTMITCGTVIAGSVHVKENVWIAPGAVVNNAVTIGERSYIGIGSVVATKVRDGRKVFGNPAKYIE